MSRRPTLALAATAVLSAVLALPAAASSDTSSTTSSADPVSGYGFQGEGEARIGDVDRRAGVLSPTAEQQAAAADLDADVRWNALGTPSAVTPVGGGHLTGPSEGTAVDIAREFLRSSSALTGLDTAAVDALEVIGDTPLYEAPDLARLREGEAPQHPDVAHVVLFRQVFGDLPAAWDGLAVVGVTRDGEVTYYSGSLARDTRVTGERSLDAVSAWTRAAADVGRSIDPATVSVALQSDDAGFTRLAVEGIADTQYARLRALPTPSDGVRPVWETVVLDNSHEEDHPEAFISFVDAQTGEVLFRSNRVDHAVEDLTTAQTTNPSSGPFSGTTAADGTVGDTHDFDVPLGNASIAVAANGNPNIEGNDGDVILALQYRDPVTGEFSTVASQDLVTAEAFAYSPAGGVPPGTYRVVVTAFVKNAGAVSYVGYLQPTALLASSTPPSPRWEVFPANPAIADPATGDAPATDTRQTWCWDEGTDCDLVLRNLASRAPWDVDARTGLHSFTTTGNNARTAPSYLSFLTPDAGAAYQPFSLTRDYDFSFTNQWYAQACDPAAFTTGNRNDIDAATVNLFVGHNRIHDWSYFLGFTERTWNLQSHNFGQPTAQSGVVPTASQGGDPELGQSQAGAVGGGPAFTGRDNANQITLQDGIPGITNQYLWQPLQAGFYAPCVDGAYDQSVIAHEYGHAIQNRMVAGPDSGLSSTQGRSMGESWADLTAIEYLNAYGYAGSTGEDPFAVGAYVTGDLDSGIRNYNMSNSPLNFSNLGYDGSGTTSPHADGEIWSATNYDLRTRLGRDYEARFPVGDRALQVRCANGELPADSCPGTRRWAQIMHDAFLLQPAGTGMIDARDAYLAADRLRFGGANQAALWDVFASRGLGQEARATNGNDADAVPGFSSPVRTDNAVVSFAATADDGTTPAGLTVYVGNYEARITPLVSTTGTGATPTAALVPGTYRFLATAPGYGAVRFTSTITAGQTGTISVPMRRNLASSAAGGSASGDGVNLDRLIDETEATNWASRSGSVVGKAVTVDLGGNTAQQVSDVQVSAALRPAVSGDADAGGQNRFSALRSFQVLTCDSTTGADCGNPASYTSVGTFRDAFPAGRPRPTAPDLNLRPFDVTDSAATHVRIVVLDNQCTGGPLYTGAANPDNDTTNDPDCVSGSTFAAATGGSLSLSQANNVRIAELQVFSPPATKPNKGGSKKG